MRHKTTNQTGSLPIRIVEVSGLGTVVLAKSKRARRLSMTVKPYKGIRVAVPYRTSFKNALAFLNSNLTWAKKNLKHIKKVEQHHQETLNDLPEINREKSRKILVNRLNELACEHGFEYNRVFVRNQKTLWGSCSHKNNINLNVNLVKLRPALMDYVLLHELVHTEIKNHSKAFWTRLDVLAGNAKKLDRELKTHILGLSMF